MSNKEQTANGVEEVRVGEQEKAPELVKGKEKEEVLVEKKPKLSQFADIFITESDTFNITVKYYKKDDQIVVSGIDENFDNKKDSKSFSMALKYPSQGDVTRITGHLSGTGDSIEDIDLREFLNLEFSRVICLMRSWTIDEDLNNSNLMKLHPKIIKSIISQVRSIIGMDGLI